MGCWGRDSGIALDLGSNLGSGFWNPDFGFPMFCGVRALGFKPQRAHGRDFKVPELKTDACYTGSRFPN